MHSFRHSRSRILFEVLCALVVSASCVGAWMQTGAWALLPAALTGLLYGFVHAFDLAGRNPPAAVAQPENEGAIDSRGDLLAYEDAGGQLAATSQQLETANAIEETEQVEPAAPRGSRGRRAKVPPKSSSRRTSAPEEVKVTEPAPPAEAEVALPKPPEEVVHLHIEPLFEAEPFARMPRRAFGRKAG